MRNLLILILFVLPSFAILFAQDVVFDGRLKDFDSGKNLGGAKVTATVNGVEKYSTTTSSNGKYTVVIPVGSDYVIRYSKDGYVSKIMDVKLTRITDEDLPIGGKIMPPVDIELFADRPEVDFSFMERQPVVVWDYDPRTLIDWDKKVYERMKKKIDNLIEEADRKEKEQEANYNKLISEADAAFKKENYEIALGKYENALKVPGKGSESHPSQRITEIDAILKKKAQEQAAAQKLEQEYQNLIQAGDNLKKEKNYQGAISRYEEASQKKPDEAYPKDQIKEVKSLIEQEKKRSEYEDIVKKADELFSQKNWETAKTEYNNALKLFPNEAHPKTQITKIDKALEEAAAEKAKKDKYDALIATADKMFNDKKYQDAISKYEEASALIPSEQHPKSQIELAKKKIQELEKEKENEEKYNKLLKLGDEALVDTKYEEAIKHYEEAISLFDREAAQTKKKVAQDRLAEQKREKEKQEKINKILAEGKKQEAAENLEGALASYNEVLALDDKNKEAKERKEAVEKKLAEIKANKEKQEKYDNLITEADKLFNEENWSPAINKYQEAGRLFPDKDYPKSQLEKIEAAKKAEAEAKANKNKYNAIITAADGLFNNDDFEGAISKYEEASKLIPAEDYPKDQIELAKKKIEEIKQAKANEEKYEKLIKQGNEALVDSKYEEAIKHYEAAIEIFDRPAAQTKKQVALDRLEEQRANAEKQEKIKQLLAEGKKQEEGENWEPALDAYKKILAIDDQHEEAATRKEDVEKKLAAQRVRQFRKAEFDKVVAEADKLYSNENWEQAKEVYKKADGIIPDDNHVKSQLTNIDNKIKELAEQKERDAKINKLFEQATAEVNQKNWDNAIGKYDEILALDGNNQRAKDEKATAQNNKKKEAEEAAQLEAFNKLKTEGDKLFSDKDWQKSKEKYEKALDIKKDATVESQISKINTELAKLQSAAEQEENYKSLMKEGDDLVAKKDYENAIRKYKGALDIKENDPVAKEKIQAAQQELEKLAKANALDENFNKAIETGKKAMENNSFDNAIAAFDEALEIKNNDPEATRLKKEAEDAKAELATFRKLKAEGQQFVAQKKWKEAKEKYLAAKDINENDNEVNAQLKLINDELMKLSSDKENEENYKKLIKEAEEFEQNEKYQEAIDKYKESLNYKSGDAFATNKIKDLEQKIKKIEQEQRRDEMYTKAMDRGLSAMNDEDFAKAIEAFDDALEIKAMDPEAIKQKEIAKGKLDELAKNEKAYQAILKKGKEKRDQDELLEAKKIYQQAQSMRPKDPIPQNAIVEIDELLRKKQEEEGDQEAIAALNLKYQEKINDADRAERIPDLDKAISLYKEASDIKPDKQFPKDKIAELEALRDKLANEEQNEKNYQDKIRKADKSFDNKDYQNSIDLYNEALSFKPSESYPKQQIDRAKAAIKAMSQNEVEAEYQKHIKKANAFFANEEYRDAIKDYENALGVKPNDQYAKDRIAESKQILDKLEAEKNQDQERQRRFDEKIKEADKLFDRKEYLAAKDKYEDALRIKNGDAYAIRKRDESILLAQQKVTSGDDARYQKIIDKADEYFTAENYDKAKGLYERALGLRSNDPYPKDQLDEIKRLTSKPVKQEKGLEYLGKEEGISIAEGAAMLAKAERQREQLKKQRVLKQVYANEENKADRESKDYEGRLSAVEEATRIRDAYTESVIDNNKSRQQLAVDLDDEMYKISLQRIQENKYERGSILRQNEEINFIIDDMYNLHTEKRDNHLATAKKIDEIKISHDEHVDGIKKQSKDKLLANDAAITEIAKNRQDDAERGIELRKGNDQAVREILDYQLEERVMGQQDNYNKLQNLQDNATLAEMRKAETSAEKAIIQKQIEEDLRLLEGELSRKNSEEKNQVRQAALEMDAILLAANEQYRETYANKDEDRKQTVERFKEIEKERDANIESRNQKKEAAIRSNTEEIEKVIIMNEEQLRKADEDLLALRMELDSQEDALARMMRAKEEADQVKRRQSSDEIENALILKSQIHSEKSKVAKDNSEVVKSIEETIDVGKRLREEEAKNKRQKTQDLLNEIMDGKEEFTETIANSLGDEYPEGVSQETFVRKDKDGIPNKIITRRIVVSDGRGEVYIRTQVNGMITYSKNGSAITENIWLKETENAKLPRNY